MKRRKFLKAALTTGAATAGLAAAANAPDLAGKEIYELRTYTMNRGQAMATMDTYLSKALIPALNRIGVKKVGVFSEVGKAEPAKIYLFIPYASMDGYAKTVDALAADKEFVQASADYNKVPVGSPVFIRYESQLMLAFNGMPQMKQPPAGPRIFEIRTYEGYSDDAVRRKIKMFNDHEFTIFDRVKLNTVFFGETLIGPKLPALTYMLWFKDMEERDKNWKAFLVDPDWVRIVSDPQFANTVSVITKVFLEPTSYSQV
jgi:hypothetical protein